MIGLKNKIRKIGAGFMAGLCAFSMLGTNVGNAVQTKAANTITVENSAFPTADTVIAQAAELLGSPYGWGFKGYTGVYYQGSYSPLSLDYVRNQGVDCSGLIYYTLTHLGYKTSGFSWNNPVPVDTIPDTLINYPIMQSDDNNFYLHHSYDGSGLQSGSVFLDYRCENRFMNPINILYGHNMKNGSMFAGVLNFADSAYFDSHRYGWIATPETVYRIDFFSCAKADMNDELYDGSMPVSQWIPHISDRSALFKDAEFSEDDRFISLSTCSYEFKNARTILTGKLVETIGG